MTNMRRTLSLRDFMFLEKSSPIVFSEAREYRAIEIRQRNKEKGSLTLQWAERIHRCCFPHDLDSTLHVAFSTHTYCIVYLAPYEGHFVSSVSYNAVSYSLNRIPLLFSE